MAIAQNSVIEFFGTQDDLDNTSAAVADGAVSLFADQLAWINDDDAPMAAVTLVCTFTVAPTAYTHVHLYATHQDIDGTNDAVGVDTNYGHFYLGSFPLNDITSLQTIPIMVSLPNVKTSQEYVFRIENRSGQSIPAGWKLLVTPKTIGPHPA